MVAWGAGQCQSSKRGNPAAPTSQIQRAMSRLYRVVEVDEAYTSSYFSPVILFLRNSVSGGLQPDSITP
jgi:hypothetical protein